MATINQIASCALQAGRARRVLQILCVILAAGVAAYIVLSGTPGSRSSTPPFDMLSYLDEKVAVQEDAKDVRCWSSFCKLQMFLAGAPINDAAISVRIEKHMELIESIWNEARIARPQARLIPEDVVTEILLRRFPSSMARARGMTPDSPSSIQVGAEAIQDYSDTIEPWRLLQTWASRHTDSSGHLISQPAFEREALDVLYNFLRTHDLAVLKRARLIALEKKQTIIDAESMSAAFQAESGGGSSRDDGKMS